MTLKKCLALSGPGFPHSRLGVLAPPGSLQGFKAPLCTQSGQCLPMTDRDSRTWAQCGPPRELSQFWSPLRRTHPLMSNDAHMVKSKEERRGCLPSPPTLLSPFSQHVPLPSPKAGFLTLPLTHSYPQAFSLCSLFLPSPSPSHPSGPVQPTPPPGSLLTQTDTPLPGPSQDR